MTIYTKELARIITDHGACLVDSSMGACANLRYANLRYADLRYADLDFFAWPLWCGSRGVIVDSKIAAQLAAHFCALSCEDPDFVAARGAIIGFARTSHRARELGIAEPEAGL